MRTHISLQLFAAAAAALVVCGCSNNTAQSKSITDTPPKGATRPAPAAVEDQAEVPAPKSVFTVDNNSRDPFFPNAKSSAPVESGAPVDTSFDVLGFLQANFHGVVSSGGKSIAYVNNVMLEEGRSAVIPIRAGGQEKLVSVRCIGVEKDAVILEVQGYGHQIRLTRSGR
jgi:hypothetical protein